MTRSVRITFVASAPGGEPRSIDVPVGSSVLDAADQAGIEIQATCGRRGRCTSCRIQAVSGEVTPPTFQDIKQLGHDAVHEGFRLSCQMTLVADCTIKPAPPRSESSHKILTGVASVDFGGIPPDSGIAKHVVQVKAPEDENRPTSDIEEVLAALPPGTAREAPLDVLRLLPTALRKEGGLLTVTAFNGHIIHIEAGDTGAKAYGMAFDIGTTSVVGALVDLQTGEQLAAVGSVNPQAVFGGDLMSRIAYAQFDEKKLQTLRGRILNALNGFIEEASTKAGIDSDHIYKIVIVGNTCMHHLCLGIDTSYVGLAPYAPTARDPIVVPAFAIPLKRAANARVCFLPIVAGFVGADTIGAVLATRLHESDSTRLLVDIGTNGEVVLGSKDRLLACSAPAGPTFEGGQIKHGMRGATGAIEKVSIGDDVVCAVIDDVPPIGICGSGLIDAAAQMLSAGIIGGDGRLRFDDFEKLPPALRARFVQTGSERAFVLAWAGESGRNENIVLTQGDIRQLQLAKAAIYGGVVMLQRLMNVADETIAEVLLSGGFGNYVNVESAAKIRLLPPLPKERIAYVGNAALMGAQLALLSEKDRHAATEIARRIEHVALATRPEYQEIFVETCAFAPGTPGAGYRRNAARKR